LFIRNFHSEWAHVWRKYHICRFVKFHQPVLQRTCRNWIRCTCSSYRHLQRTLSTAASPPSSGLGFLQCFVSSPFLFDCLGPINKRNITVQLVHVVPPVT
jgi:hypothetical protein